MLAQKIVVNVFFLLNAHTHQQTHTLTGIAFTQKLYVQGWQLCIKNGSRKMEKNFNKFVIQGICFLKISFFKKNTSSKNEFLEKF